MVKPIYILTVLLILLFNPNLNSTTYYVDNSGGNDANSGKSPDEAWNSISKVNSKSFSSGDTISFKCGDRLTDATLFPPINNLTFNSYGTGSRPIIDGQSLNRCVDLIKKSKDKITFTGIKFVNGFPSDITMWNCNNITFESCNIDSSKGNDIHDCNIYSGGTCSNLTIKNSTLSYSQQGTDPNQGNLGIYLDGTANILMEYDTLIGNFSNIRIGFGVNTFTNGLIVRYCVLRNPRWDNIDDDGSAGARFYYNFFETSMINVYLFTDGSGNYDAFATKNCSYYNNTFISHGKNGSVHVHSKTGITNGIVFKNNIFFSDNSAGYFLYEESDGSSWPMGSWTFTNNLYYMISPGRHQWSRRGVNYKTFAKWQSLGYDANSINADPLFTDYKAGDYSLQSGSKAIGGGTNVGLTNDIKGTHVSTSAPDIGAFQFQDNK
jgi:hypothetical protein